LTTVIKIYYTVGLTMPAAPNLITYTNWINETDFFIGKRSPKLLLIDNDIQQYALRKTPVQLENLKFRIRDWLDTKKDGETGRDKKTGAVTALIRHLDLITAQRPAIPSVFAGIEVGDDLYRGDKWVPDDFKGRVEQGLDEINRFAVGQKLLQRIGAACDSPSKKVIIEYGPNSAAPFDHVDPAVARNMIQRPGIEWLETRNKSAYELLKDPRLTNGTGMGAIVIWDPSVPGHPDYSPRPEFIPLAHELIHALHYLEGTLVPGYDGMIPKEEYQTVGIHEYYDVNPSENRIRHEHGVIYRLEYQNEGRSLRTPE
jgi:Effector protein